MSLQAWERVGMLEREIALYLRLQQLGVRVSFVTYGNSSELKYAERLKGINILCNRWHLPIPIYEQWLPWLHAPALLRAHLFKSNQISGADVALQAARFWHKPFIARGGYLYSIHTENQYGKDSPITQNAVRIEKKVYTQANHIIVTAPFMVEFIHNQYQIHPQNITIIPNYVDTQLFKPSINQPENGRHLCFIGRLEKQKNVDSLLEALGGLDATIDIVGSGSLEEELRKKAAEIGVAAQFLGNLPHTSLPEVINRAALYVQPSLYEGHPKTILEAMACGKAVLGGNSPGIREVIQHGTNGWLCGTTAQEIRQAILELLGDSALRRKLGENAHNYVLHHCSLDKVSELEIALYYNLLNNFKKQNNILNKIIKKRFPSS